MNARPLLAVASGRSAGLGVLWAAELILLSLLVPGYFSVFGLLDASRQFVEAGLVALGMTLVITPVASTCRSARVSLWSP